MSAFIAAVFCIAVIGLLIVTPMTFVFCVLFVVIYAVVAWVIDAFFNRSVSRPEAKPPASDS